MTTTIAVIGTTLGTLLTALVGVLLGVANFRKTQAETRKLLEAPNLEDVAPGTSPKDSESKLLTMLTTQLQTSYDRADKLFADLEECRNRRARLRSINSEVDSNGS